MPKLESVGNAELQEIMPPHVFLLWNKVIDQIDRLYEMDKEWDKGGKQSKYVLRFRRGGKTLVSLFPKENAVGVMVVYGKDERIKFESNRSTFSDEVSDEYDKAHTYHDGKWIMFYLPGEKVLNDLPALLAIKRRPNRKVNTD
ncbi:MAG: DUF3788 domain-containing protein [Acidobacteriota bacterium]|jgi:hypothetical protein|nr:DUF3788 domain-containing protein [Acidobacteriota bacterium]